MHPQIEKYEDQGLLLHPCNSDKTPVLRGWQQAASADREKHEEWFEVNHYKVGLLTGKRNGIVVVDFDDRDVARQFYRELRSKIRCIVETPRGEHFYFKHPGGEIRNAVRTKIGELVADIRGEGGFVIAPFTYRFIPDFELDMRKLETFDPSWIQKNTRKRIETIHDDVLRRIFRATKWMEKAEPAVSGQQGHNKLFSVCCALKQKFGLTIEQAYPLILMYNERCQPPFSGKEVSHKMNDVWSQGETR